jgi:hypothetical protein
MEPFPRFIDIVTESPPVSPSVVARILIIQNPSVTSGTLLIAPANSLVMLPSLRFLKMNRLSSRERTHFHRR